MELVLSQISKAFRLPSKHRSVLNQWMDGVVQEKILENFSLSFTPGEKVLIVGKNGVGKTTLLKIAAGLLLPDSGKIMRASSPGLMLSHAFLYTLLTGRQNLEYSGSLYGCGSLPERVREAQEAWGLTPFLDKQVIHYSNGQKTSLALARANIHSPSLLLLDEPLVFLDNEQKLRFFEFVRRSRQTIVMTAQDSSQFEAAVDRVISL